MAVTWRITDDHGRLQRRAKDFVARMGRIPVKVKKRINAANEKSAEDLAAMMVRLAPRDRGDLERSIRYYEVTEAAGAGVTWRVVAGDEKAYQARWIEYGTPTMHAQPFFWPAWRAMRRLIRSRALKAWRQGLKDAE